LAAARYRAERTDSWNTYARKPASAGYYQRLAEIYRYLVPARSRMLELGCGTGDLLAALEPSLGVGIDLAPELLERGAQSHPEHRLLQGDISQFSLNTKFDYVVLADVVNDLWDVQTSIERVASVCTPATRVIINTYSRVWELPLWMAARINLANPTLPQNWLTLADLDNLLALSGFEVIRQWQEVLFPLAVPLLAPFCNRYLVKLWPFRYLALTNFIVARLRPESITQGRGPEPLVSVIVPARNEAGNIEQVVRRVPEMGAGTEIIFVEGHSHDDTYAAIEAAIARHPHARCGCCARAGRARATQYAWALPRPRAEC
jgi:SAM-dependent methyltransferase